jgi:hypothetical protein
MEVTSPITRILASVPSSLINIAPEREQETRALLNGIEFELNDDLNFGFFGAPGSPANSTVAGTIGVPERGVELLWVMSYALWGRYQDYLQRQAGGSSTISLNASVPLLNWSLPNQGAATRSPWPANLPRPTGFEVSNGAPSLERVADELTMCATGWLLHHELTHVVRGDSPNVPAEVSREQERNADWSATCWLLDQSPSGMALEKRVLGIATGILCLVALELEGKVKSGPLRPYPAAAERLTRCLSHPRLTSGVSADLIIAIGLRLLIDLFEIALAPSDFETAPDCVEAYGLAIEQALNSGGVPSRTG